MTRNQKIALGCGGAGCLGLIVVAIAAVLIYSFAKLPMLDGRANSNVTTNRNSNLNDNSNSDSDTNDNSNSSSTSSTTASSLSNDDQHKLYQAAAMTGDQELLRRVSVKLGLMGADFQPGERYSEFLTEHVGWVLRNGSFIQSINSTEKARAYVDQNFPN
jgi:hypothetical protein